MYLDNLAKGEHILFRAKKTAWVLIDTIVYTLFAVIFIVCFYAFDWFGHQPANIRAVLAFSPLLITIVLLINDILNYYYLEVAVTSTRVLGKKGLIGVTVLDVPINSITDMRVDISALGRIFKYGKITIFTPSGEFVYEDINDPLKIQSTINSILTNTHECSECEK